MNNSIEIWQVLVIFTVGSIAGFINTLAGGGSLLTLPVLIFMGLPAPIANGTNRLAIFVQSIFAVAGFKRKGIANFRLSLILSGPIVLGAIFGAWLAVDMSDVLFKRILAAIMLLVLFLILWNPIGRIYGSVEYNSHKANTRWGSRILMIVIFFFIGTYGGFIQAGIGFLIIAALTAIGGLNLVETNSQKVFIVGMNALCALFIFVFYDKIYWSIGLALSAGNGLGGWIGSHVAVNKGERFIRIVLTVCVIGMVIKLLV